MEVGLKDTVTPLGWPLAVKVMAESKPSVTALVMVEVPEAPCNTETELGEAESVKPGAVVKVESAMSRLSPFGLPKPHPKL
jgi:hypothetical protein